MRSNAEFVSYVRSGNVEKVREFLDAKSDPNFIVETKSEKTVYHQAPVYLGNGRWYNYTVPMKMPNLTTESVLEIAVNNNNVAIARLLLEYGANVNLRALLRMAINNNRVPMAKLLLEYGAHVNLNATINAYFSTTNVHISMVNLLLEYKANVSLMSPGKPTTLYYALTNCKGRDRNQIILRLLEHGANATVYNGDSGVAIYNGSMSMLHVAIQYRYSSTVIQAMIDRGASLSRQMKMGISFNGFTAFIVVGLLTGGLLTLAGMIFIKEFSPCHSGCFSIRSSLTPLEYARAIRSDQRVIEVLERAVARRSAPAIVEAGLFSPAAASVIELGEHKGLQGEVLHI